MSQSDWIQKRNNSESIIWQNRQKDNITIEAHVLDDESVDEPIWYIYGALDGQGVPHSPSMVEKKKDAIRIIASLKKRYKSDGIQGFVR